MPLFLSQTFMYNLKTEGLVSELEFESQPAKLNDKCTCCTLRSWVHEIFSQYRTVSRDWETAVCQNVALTFFHTQNIRHNEWKTLRTTL